MSKPFIHLHVHTEYSLLDGACRLTKGKSYPLIDACKQKNMPAIAITDHGTMYGVFTFQKACINNGIKPILGCELYLCEDMHDKTVKDSSHILLLAKNDIGYKNLVKLDSIAHTEGFYYKPRIDINFLREHSEGLICTSACIGGAIPQLLIRGEYLKAKELATVMKNIFAPGDYYLELQDHGIPEEKMCNPLLVKIAREIGVKVVATNDAHYIEKSDAEMHDVLLCIQTKSRVSEQKRMRFYNDQFYLKTYEEMEQLFSWCPEALETPFEIAEKCNATIKKNDLMPPYFPPDNLTPEEYLKNLATEGLSKRYGVITEEIKERAKYELDIIIKMGFAEYYLIVWDFIDYARKNNISVGAGRGSGVGSIIAYAIGITNVEPLRFNLLFERFLNPERVSNPDFDIDFCVEGRGKVIDYVISKYGADKVCQILALGTLATKNAIKDTARAYEIPLDEVNRITKFIPNGKVSLESILGIKSKKTEKKLEKKEDKKEENKKEDLKIIEDETEEYNNLSDEDKTLLNSFEEGGEKKDDKNKVIPEVLEAYNNNPEMRKVLDIAMLIEGMPKNCSKHAAGVVICKEVISDFVPLSKTGQDITTQFQKEEVEEVGMLKMDFLGLRTLTDIDKAKKYIKENSGVIIDFETLGYEDENVYKLLGTGETDAVFQLESPGMKKFMRDLKPESLEDIIAGISLYRPGPMDSIPKYIESKNNPDKISYDHPLLEPILNMTYGCIVYQEQVMQIVQSLSGYTYGRADILRRAMGKKKKDVMIKERKTFVIGATAKPAVLNKDGSLKTAESVAVDGAKRRGVPVKVAAKIFDTMMSFASYAFNKSHAAAYAVLAYETAYLKTYYPVEFITAVINNRITNQDEIAKYVEYLRQTKTEVYPPDINKSGVYFTCENQGARYGLMGVKNVGETAITAVCEERIKNGEFKSLNDFIKRTISCNINKRLVESLIKGGAFDCFGNNRATLLANYEHLMLICNHDKNLANNGQISMFSMMSEEIQEEPLKFVKEFSKSELLVMEKEMLNVYMTGHPLDEYREKLIDMDFNLSLIKPLLTLDAPKMQEEDEIEDLEEDSEIISLIEQFNKKNVQLGGILGEIRTRVTKNNKTMAICKIEDLFGIVDIVLFPSTYEKYKHLLIKDNIVIIGGELQVSDRPQISVKNIELLTQLEENTNKDLNNKKDLYINKEIVGKLYLNIPDADKSKFEEVMNIISFYKGSTPCYIKFGKKLLDSGYCVNYDNSLYYELIGIVGENNCKSVK